MLSVAERLHLLDEQEPTWGELADMIGVPLSLPEPGHVVGLNAETAVQLYWPWVPPSLEEDREPVVRVSGGWICECGRTARDHEMRLVSGTDLYIHLLCDGRWAKL